MEPRCLGFGEGFLELAMFSWVLKDEKKFM